MKSPRTRTHTSCILAYFWIWGGPWLTGSPLLLTPLTVWPLAAWIWGGPWLTGSPLSLTPLTVWPLAACSSHIDESESKPSHAPQGIFYAECHSCHNPPYFQTWGLVFLHTQWVAVVRVTVSCAGVICHQTSVSCISYGSWNAYEKKNWVAVVHVTVCSAGVVCHPAAHWSRQHGQHVVNICCLSVISQKNNASRGLNTFCLSVCLSAYRWQ